MNRLAPRAEPGAVAVARLARLAPLDPAALAALSGATACGRIIGSRRELMREGERVGQPLLLLDGWAGEARLLPDGRRQILSFLLPGDLIGEPGLCDATALSTVVALTDVAVCPAPGPGAVPSLGAAYAAAQRLREACLLGAVTRLGRLDAQERLCDLFLELHERLDAAGLADGGAFDLPVTQEMLADALGLTPVHLNRTLQLCRRQGDLTLRSGRLELASPVQLADRVGRLAFRP
jgi:CRP-like cAMP-binding protein